MKWRFLFAVLLLASCSTAGNGPAIRRINDLEEEWNRSRLEGDARNVSSLLDDHWTIIHVDGRVEEKESYVRGIASGGRQIQLIEVRDREVHVYGDVAIVTGEAHQRGVRRGEVREGHLRFVHVWVRHGGTWQMTLSQSTEITAAP